MGKSVDDVPKLRRGIRWEEWEKEMLTCLRHANVSAAWKREAAPKPPPARMPVAVSATQVARTVTKTPLAATVLGRASGATVSASSLDDDDVKLYQAARAENAREIERHEKLKRDWDDKCETILGYLGGGRQKDGARAQK